MLFAVLGLSAQQNNITGYEYWLDDNYAVKTSQAVSPSTTFQWQTTIPCDNLATGIHTFSARFIDVTGLWSPTVSRYFYKMPIPTVINNNTIVNYEYWIDNEARVMQTISPTKQYNMLQNIDVDKFGEGLHSVNIRFEDNQGEWSSVLSRYFYKLPIPTVVDNKLVAYEYWINDDYTNKVKVQIPPQQTFVLLDSVNCSSANKVLNTLSYRFLDNSGLWSSTMTSNFYGRATISVSLMYTKSVLQGETPTVDNFYPNYADVGFTVYNLTKKQDITDIAYQYPNIVLNQQVNVGDSLLITAISHSTTNGFEPVAQKIVVGNDVSIPVTFNIVQRGLIRSNYQGSENNANVGIVYDSNGQRIAQYDYVNQTLDTDPLADGTYQLLSMANSPLYNTIQNLSAFASTPLKQNTDYILQTLTVKSGIITVTTIPTVPKLDEASVLYTTNNTSFSVNKTSIAIGNYVTLRSEIEFKGAYQTQVSNVKLIVDIPEQCSFVNNSVMTGSAIFNGYTLQNNQLTIPLANYSDVVKFCIIPTQGDAYAPNGFIEFTLNGNTIRQPIGTANFTAEGLSIVVPSLTAQNTIPVSGIVTANSLVKIYDGDQQIGQTTALANGNWNTKCDLYKPYAFSLHEIHAEVTTPQGLAMQTETKEVVHNISAIEVSKVTMYNTAHQSGSLDLYEYTTVFDFLNPPKQGGIYWYWPNYPDFTFKIEFTNNDPNLISDVKLNVLTASGSTVSLPTVYDNVQEAWVATSKFPNSSNLPVNVSVDFQKKDIELEIDSSMINDIFNDILSEIEITDERNLLNEGNHIRNIMNINNTSYYVDYCELPSIYKSSLIAGIQSHGFTEWGNDNTLFISDNSVILLIDSVDIFHTFSLINQNESAILDIISANQIPSLRSWNPFSGWFGSKSPREIQDLNRIDALCACNGLDGLDRITICDAGQESMKKRLEIQYGIAGVLPVALSYQAFTEIRHTNPDPKEIGSALYDWYGIVAKNKEHIENYSEPTKNAVSTILQIEKQIYSMKNPCDNTSDFSQPNATFTLDPSGYVYEAVPSNRLQGVTAGVYHKTQTEDMYGNVTENIVLWNATNYGQVNPQITNEYGEYAWDVPQDVWQVKYEKEGYTTVYSDWLPVPPPQLNINVAMVQAVPPQVAKVQGYESGIEITFDKFMQPVTMTPDFITVTRNGAAVTGTITLLDAEVNPANSAESFVSKVRFVPDVNFSTSDNVILTVKHTVQSYTGNEMDNDFIQQIAIQTEVKSISATPALNIALHDNGLIEVTAAPNNAAAGKTITARCISSALATVTGNAVLDANGKATLQVTGELPGSTQVEIALDGTDLKTIVNVNIAMPTAASQVEMPVASIPSGSTVEKNTEITLSSATEGAVIRYTTDGSTPTGSTGLEYTQPIVITDNVTIQAIAVKEGMLDSEVATFEYKVSSTTGINQPDQPDRTAVVFVKNQTLFIRGFEPGEQYTVYSILGKVVAHGKVTDKVEQKISLPYKGIFIVSTPSVTVKVTVK